MCMGYFLCVFVRGSYFPLYAKRGIVQSLVSVNVPFDLPVLEFGTELYKVQPGNSSVVFAPHGAQACLSIYLRVRVQLIGHL